MARRSRLPEPVETVLFDAGGVLLDLDYGYVRRLIEVRRIEVGEDVLAKHESEARREIHRQVEKGGCVSDAWRDYFHIILGRTGVPAADQPEIVNALWEAHHRVGLWTIAIQRAPEVVTELKRRGYRIGVVSNAEGRVEQDLNSAGYEGLLETVIDSHVVGVEKPDPQIFRMALDRLGVEPDTAVFVGDVPAVDVVGARAAGISPILLDRHDMYTDIDVPRLSAIDQLPAMLDPDAEWG